MNPGYKDTFSRANNIRCYALLVLLPAETTGS